MPVLVKFDNTTSCPQQAQIIPDATPFNDGVMTKAQAAQLASLDALGGDATTTDHSPVALATIDLPQTGTYLVQFRGLGSSLVAAAYWTGATGEGFFTALVGQSGSGLSIVTGGGAKSPTFNTGGDSATWTMGVFVQGNQLFIGIEGAAADTVVWKGQVSILAVNH